MERTSAADGADLSPIGSRTVRFLGISSWDLLAVFTSAGPAGIPPPDVLMNRADLLVGAELLDADDVIAAGWGFDVSAGWESESLRRARDRPGPLTPQANSTITINVYPPEKDHSN